MRVARCCLGLCLWCHVLGDHVQISTPRLCTVPGHLPALSWFRVSISLFILMRTCEVEPWAPALPPSAPPPQGWPLMIHPWEEKDSPSLMDEAVPEAFAFRRGFRSGYQVRGQTLAFQALPPSQVTDRPSWDKELLIHGHTTSATPPVIRGDLSPASSCTSVSQQVRCIASLRPPARRCCLDFQGQEGQRRRRMRVSWCVSAS